MEGSISPRTNRLLAQLASPALSRLRPFLQFYEHEVGESLVEEAQRTQYMHFPVTGVISRMVQDHSGKSNEFGVCGREGAVGLSALSGGTPIRPLTTSLVVVKTAGYRIDARIIEAELQNAELRSIIIRYFRYVLAEAMLTSFCNKYHSLHQQFCRILLLMTDRVPVSEIRTTHQMMSQIVGARREAITQIVGRLHSDKILTLHRGTLRIMDQEGLLTHTCECYERMKERYNSLLMHPKRGGVYP